MVHDLHDRPKSPHAQQTLQIFFVRRHSRTVVRLRLLECVRGRPFFGCPTTKSKSSERPCDLSPPSLSLHFTGCDWDLAHLWLCKHTGFALAAGQTTRAGNETYVQWQRRAQIYNLMLTRQRLRVGGCGNKKRAHNASPSVNPIYSS